MSLELTRRRVALAAAATAALAAGAIFADESVVW